MLSRDGSRQALLSGVFFLRNISHFQWVPIGNDSTSVQYFASRAIEPRTQARSSMNHRPSGSRTSESSAPLGSRAR